jgi:hypothetical protein
MVQHDIDDHAKPAPVRFREQPIEVGQAAEVRIDRLVIADVVPEVDVRRRVKRRHPDRINTEVLEVRQPARDPVQVADAIVVGVLKTAEIHLVETARAPPRHLFNRPQSSRGVSDPNSAYPGEDARNMRFFVVTALHASPRTLGG